MSDSKTTVEQIRAEAKLALASNRISEVQEKNLKMFPFVFFDNVKSIKIDYDFTNTTGVDTEEDKKNLEIKYKFKALDTKHFRVSYFIQFQNDTQIDNLENRFAAIERAVRNLFWNETKIQVFFNDELKYESKNV